MPSGRRAPGGTEGPARGCSSVAPSGSRSRPLPPDEPVHSSAPEQPPESTEQPRGVRIVSPPFGRDRQQPLAGCPIEGCGGKRDGRGSWHFDLHLHPAVL